jgi:hypothetical protein
LAAANLRAFFSAAAVVAAAGFLLSGNKRNKNASRPFNLLDFLILAVSATQAARVARSTPGFALHFSFTSLLGDLSTRLRFENLRKLKNAAELPKVAVSLILLFM